MRRLPTSIAGARVYLDAASRDVSEAAQAWEAATTAALSIQEAGGIPMMSRSQDVNVPERVSARRANRMGSDLIVAFRLTTTEDCVFYFASEHSHSAAGEQLARSLVAHTGGTVEGRASAMLKETRAPAAVISRTSLDEKVGYSVANGLAEFFASAAATR